MPEKELTPPSYLPAMQFPSAFTAIPGSLHPGMQFFSRIFGFIFGTFSSELNFLSHQYNAKNVFFGV